jgi:antitoxin VapB
MVEFFHQGKKLGINIKNAEVEAAVRRLAAELGVDLTGAIRLAVEAELERTSRSRRGRLRRMRAVADRVAALPLLDRRTDEEILGYDSTGLPA